MEKVPNWSVIIIFKKENNNLEYTSVFSKIDNILWKFDKSKYIANKRRTKSAEITLNMDNCYLPLVFWTGLDLPWGSREFVYFGIHYLQLSSLLHL